MHLSSLMVHASYREGFPSTLIQAGAMNCPIVCSAIEGSVDVVTDKETGILFKAQNAGDLQDKLTYALEHQEEMVRYASALREKIEKYFSQSYVHNCLKEKYKDNLYINIILGDFFKHEGEYELILEQTFFCSINPPLRKDYKAMMKELLAQRGKRIEVLIAREFE